MLVWAWQLGATVFCLLGALALTPVSWIEEWVGQGGDGYGVVEGGRRRRREGKRKGRVGWRDSGKEKEVDGIEMSDLGRRGRADG